MPEILQLNLVDVLGKLPEVVPWNPSLIGDGGVHVLVCCVGFEDRARAIFGDIRDIAVESVVGVVYPTNQEDNAVSFDAFKGCAAPKKRVEIEYDRRSFLKSIRESLAPFSEVERARVVIDLSGMASYVVYRVLWAVFEMLPQAELGIYYTEAEHYSPSQKEWQEFYMSVSDPDDNLAMAERYEETHFQSIGVDETYESDVFPGRNIGPLATEVIAMPSFSLQRMKSMLAYAKSQYSVPHGNVRWFLGQPPDRKKNGWRYDALTGLYNVRNQGVAVSTLNYRETLQQLDAVWEDQQTPRHLVIASMGSKMQHLGTFLFLKMHPECGLLLCEPKKFKASSYSTGVGAKWWLDFGTVAKIEKLLQSRGTLKFDWS